MPDSHVSDPSCVEERKSGGLILLVLHHVQQLMPRAGTSAAQHFCWQQHPSSCHLACLCSTCASLENMICLASMQGQVQCIPQVRADSCPCIWLQSVPALPHFVQENVGAEELHLCVHPSLKQLHAVPSLLRAGKLGQPHICCLALCGVCSI